MVLFMFLPAPGRALGHVFTARLGGASPKPYEFDVLRLNVTWNLDSSTGRLLLVNIVAAPSPSHHTVSSLSLEHAGDNGGDAIVGDEKCLCCSASPPLSR